MCVIWTFYNNPGSCWEYRWCQGSIDFEYVIWPTYSITLTKFNTGAKKLTARDIPNLFSLIYTCTETEGRNDGNSVVTVGTKCYHNDNLWLTTLAFQCVQFDCTSRRPLGLLSLCLRDPAPHEFDPWSKWSMTLACCFPTAFHQAICNPIKKLPQLLCGMNIHLQPSRSSSRWHG